MLYAYRAVMTVGVGILYDFPILYFVLLAINVFIPSKSLTCGYSISVPDTLPHCTYILLISAPAVIPKQKSDSFLANPL